MYRHIRIHRQESDIINLILFLKNMKIRLQIMKIYRILIIKIQIIQIALKILESREFHRCSDGFRSGRQGQQILLFSAASRPALTPPEVSYPMGTGCFSPGVKTPMRDTNHSISSSVQVKKGGAIPPFPHIP